jgi:hypothetical protein
MCNFNKRAKTGRMQDTIKKCSMKNMIDPMKMLMQWESSTNSIPVATWD